MVHNTISSYRFNFLPDRCNEILMRLTGLPLHENEQVKKKLNLIQENMTKKCNLPKIKSLKCKVSDVCFSQQI